MRKLKVRELVPNIRLLQPGDIVAVPLHNGKWAYGRRYKDATIGVFRLLGDGPINLELFRGKAMAFYVGTFCTPRQKLELDWVFLGSMPFKSEDDAWAPPPFSEEMASPGHFRIYCRGRLSPATPEQLNGLQKQVSSSPKSIRNRILEESRDWPTV